MKVNYNTNYENAIPEDWIFKNNVLIKFKDFTGTLDPKVNVIVNCTDLPETPLEYDAFMENGELNIRTRHSELNKDCTLKPVIEFVKNGWQLNNRSLVYKGYVIDKDFFNNDVLEYAILNGLETFSIVGFRDQINLNETFVIFTTWI